MSTFINPYNFVSISDRNTAGSFGDQNPTWHGANAKETISGSVTIRFEAKTPLLLSKAAAEGDSQTRTTRKDGVDLPYLLGSSLKGSLRSAYEAITNSRLEAFDSPVHQYRGAKRQNPKDALNLYPAIVNEYGEIEVLIPNGGTNKSLYAVRAGMRSKEQFLRELGMGESESLDRVKCFATLSGGRAAKVLKVFKDAHAAKASGGTVVEGIFHWTNGKFGNKKKNERFFITRVVVGRLPSPNIQKLKLEKSHQLEWKHLLESFKRAHVNDKNKGALGTYITRTKDVDESDDLWSLSAGRTVWARLEKPKSGQWELAAVFPVMIGRELLGNSPYELASRVKDILPAKEMSALSPSDRVFGWVNTQQGTGQASYKGQLFFGRVKCVGDRDEIIEEFNPPITLAVLNSAKTSQWRFYTKPALHQSGQWKEYGEFARLRGRKFYYPHIDTFPDEELGENYWTHNKGREIDGTQPARFREFLKHGEDSDKDHSSVETKIDSWVKPGTTFEITLHLHNVTKDDASALLWLLDIGNVQVEKNKPKHPVLQIGAGKPLGFGSIACTIDLHKTEIYDDSENRKRYLSIANRLATNDQVANSTSKLVEELKDHFEKVAGRKDPSGPEVNEAIRLNVDEFICIASGYRAQPVHYPRATVEPKGKQYEWFRKDKNSFLPNVSSQPPTLIIPEESAERDNRKNFKRRGFSKNSHPRDSSGRARHGAAHGNNRSRQLHNDQAQK